jgi:acid phosphatase
LEFLKRVQDTGLPLNGSLAFFQNWTYITDRPENDFGQLTRTGPYAGTLSSFTTGVQFRTLYGNLIPKGTKTRLWASDSGRVIETARHFASGFYGLDWDVSGKAELQIIPETFERGADTLTPGDTCHKYLEDTIHGHDNGQEMLARFQESYIPKIAERLMHEGNFGLKGLSNTEVYAMQEMCGFEIMARGSSPWCAVFTEQDWRDFEYARDLIHYYRAGPGNPYSGSMGWLLLNATAALLRDGPVAGSLFFSL